MFCRELGCRLHPPPCSPAGHPSPGVSNVDRLLPEAVCLPRGLNRPAFIKSLETSEGKRCVGRYVSQPGWGWGFDDSPQPLGSPCGLQPRARAGKGGLEGGGRLAGSSVGGSSPLPLSCQALSHLPGCPPHLYCSVRQKMIMEKQPAPSRQAQQINKSPNLLLRLLPGGAPLGPEPWASFGTHHRHGAPSAVPLRDRSTSHLRAPKCLPREPLPRARGSNVAASS